MPDFSDDWLLEQIRKSRLKKRKEIKGGKENNEH